MAYKPTPIETPQQRFEKVFWPAYFERQNQEALQKQRAELEAGLAPGGRMRVDAMDPSYRRAELAAQAADAAAKMSQARLAQMKAQGEAALINPKIQNLEARSIERLSAADKRKREMRLAEGKYMPELENLQARTDWIGKEKPALGWDKSSLEWAKFMQDKGYDEEWLKLQWSKARKKGSGKAVGGVAADLIGQFSKDLGSGGAGESRLVADPVSGEPVEVFILNPSDQKQAELAAMKFITGFHKMPKEAKAETYRQILSLTGKEWMLADADKYGLPPIEGLVMEYASGVGRKSRTEAAPGTGAKLETDISSREVGLKADAAVAAALEKERSARDAAYKDTLRRKDAKEKEYDAAALTLGELQDQAVKENQFATTMGFKISQTKMEAAKAIVERRKAELEKLERESRKYEQAY